MTDPLSLYNIGEDWLAKLESDGKCKSLGGEEELVTFSTVELSKVFRCVESLSEAKINGVAAKEFFDRFAKPEHSDDALYSKGGSLTVSRTTAVALIAGLAGVGLGCLPEATPDLLKGVVTAEAAVILSYLASILTDTKAEPEVSGSAALVYVILKQGEYSDEEIADRASLGGDVVQRTIHRLLTLKIVEPGVDYEGLCTWRGSESLPRHLIKPESLSLVQEHVFQICCRGSYLPKEIGRRTGLTTAKIAIVLRELLEKSCVACSDDGRWTAQEQT